MKQCVIHMPVVWTLMVATCVNVMLGSLDLDSPAVVCMCMCNCKLLIMSYTMLCSDIDECSGENHCDENASCNNTFGSYTCDCKSGYSGDGWNCTSMWRIKTLFVVTLLFTI